jgi:tetratricopeptide (TPR) repeat protein
MRQSLAPRIFKRLRPWLCAALVLVLLSGCFSGRGGEYGFLERAEELSREGKYQEAIEAYRSHMAFRLKVPKRPEWENPYFYLILIGDIQLGQGLIEEAEKSYALAEENKVDEYLVSDRFRGIARWYEEQGKLSEAIEFLGRYRDRDPLLYESMLDRLAKELTLKEDSGASVEKASPRNTASSELPAGK